MGSELLMSEEKREALRAHLAEGADQARRGEFVEDFTMDALIDDLDCEK